MKTYWYIQNKDDNDAYAGVAKAPGNKTLVDWANEINTLGKIPFEFKVNSKDHLEDFLADTLGIPLMSDLLMNIINKHLTGKEGLEWYKAIINYKNEKITYYAPKFKSNLDILNNEKSLFNKANGSLIKANIKLSKVEEYAFFPLPKLSDSIPFAISIIVTDEIKKEITKAKLTGIDFSKVPIS